MLNLDLETKGYEISICRNQVNDKLAESGLFISRFLVFGMIGNSNLFYWIWYIC